MSSSGGTDLTRAALRASRSEKMIGGLLPHWERVFEQPPAEFLDAGPANMTSLALCTRPDQKNWTRDVVDIATACGIDAVRLATFLRQAMSVERLASAPAADGVVDGRLLAARDRTDDEK